MSNRQFEFDLQRFVNAQNGELMPFCSDYQTAVKEIKSGKKLTHWIWYVLPQLKRLGHSEMCDRYGIDGLKEAEAYLKNDLLKNRLVEMAKAICIGLNETDNVITLFGGTLDATKAQASLTLFHEAAMIINDQVSARAFQKALNAAFDGERHVLTMSHLGVDMECLL